MQPDSTVVAQALHSRASARRRPWRTRRLSASRRHVPRVPLGRFKGSTASSPLNGLARSDAGGTLRYVLSPGGFLVQSPALVPTTPGMALVVRAGTIQQLQLNQQGQPTGSSSPGAPFAPLESLQRPPVRARPGVLAGRPVSRVAPSRYVSVSGGGQHAFLMVFDTRTQQIVLPGGRDLGVNKFVFGLSLAELPTITGFTIGPLLRQNFTLSPTMKIPSPVGILVQRVVGTHVLLGRRVPLEADRSRAAREGGPGPQPLPLEREGERSQAQAGQISDHAAGTVACWADHRSLASAHPARNALRLGAR